MIVTNAERKAAYDKAAASKVGDKCQCGGCGTFFTKTSYQQKFCKSKGKTRCKDTYWNSVDSSRVTGERKKYVDRARGFVGGRAHEVGTRIADGLFDRIMNVDLGRECWDEHKLG